MISIPRARLVTPLVLACALAWAPGAKGVTIAFDAIVATAQQQYPFSWDPGVPAVGDQGVIAVELSLAGLHQVCGSTCGYYWTSGGYSVSLRFPSATGTNGTQFDPDPSSPTGFSSEGEIDYTDGPSFDTIRMGLEDVDVEGVILQLVSASPGGPDDRFDFGGAFGSGFVDLGWTGTWLKASCCDYTTGRILGVASAPVPEPSAAFAFALGILLARALQRSDGSR